MFGICLCLRRRTKGKQIDKHRSGGSPFIPLYGESSFRAWARLDSLTQYGFRGEPVRTNGHQRQLCRPERPDCSCRLLLAARTLRLVPRWHELWLG
jgi:hypothetical protein